MRYVVISLIVILGTWTTLAAQERRVLASQSAQAPAEETKNTVEQAIDESKKRGETVIGGCLQDCGEKSADSAKADKGVAAQIIELPKPVYPPIARAAHASGIVNVQVLIDFDGQVIAAAVLDGHPLLQSAAVSAARQARFGPTLLEGQPVKVTGIIRYTFTAW